MEMKPIIDPIDRGLLESELTKDKFIRITNNGGNEIYIVDYYNSPNLVREIGRLREISFRDAGGGTGKDCDLDEFDIDVDVPYKQLLVWNPRDKEIIGGYRYVHGKDLRIKPDGHVDTPTAELFELREKFVKEYLPITIELGRSFVQPAYQPTFDLRKGMYSLDNIWNGLGAIVVLNSDVKYFFGKITMYPQFNIKARDLILFFMKKYFGGDCNLVYPKKSLLTSTPESEMAPIFNETTYEKNYKILIQQVKALGESIPPLVNAYMNLSSTMVCFGTSLNPGFGDVEETAILMTIDDIYDFKKERHIDTYKPDLE
jgi:hypothetical protein